MRKEIKKSVRVKDERGKSFIIEKGKKVTVVKKKQQSVNPD